MAMAVTTSCVDDDKLQYAFEKPASIEGYEYLAKYDALKSYESNNSKASSDFKLGVALAATDYNADGLVTRLANSNFEEIVAGNEMKMGSIVNDNGEMDFGTVETFVRNADEAEMNVYGHTLAWHAQQPVKWLNRLLKDKELDIDPEAKLEKLTSVNSFENRPDGPFPYYPMGCEPPIVNGAMHFEATGAWSQFFIFPGGDGNTLPEGDYLIRLYMKANREADGLQLTIQNGWGAAQQININFSTVEGDQVYELQCPGITAIGDNGPNYDVILKPQTANVILDVKKIEFYKLETPVVEVEQLVNEQTYTDGPFPFYPMGCEPPVINGAIHFVPTGAWSQFFCMPGANNPLTEGDYAIYLDLESDKDVDGVQFTIQNGWGGTDQNISVSVPVVAGRQGYRLNFPGVTASGSQGGNYDCILKPQTANATLDLYSVKVYKVVKMNSIPLTPEEKRDTLLWAMDKWISGMMEACDGKVKAWDVVNEAVGQGEKDIEGVYKLQHGTEGDKDNFFWQDYLGDTLYVRAAVAMAREYGPEDIKLFINDYNLESDWDQNGKVKSLIAWIKRWEEDGVTKIDGIGSQMHIWCYSNAEVQNSKKNGIVNMLKELAKSGKLIRISELDMGYTNGTTGNEEENMVATANMTEEQHKQMAELYNWVIQQYFEIIPAAQQWGICQWCATDSPSGSAWRKNQPTGLWDLNYNRKHTYAGFATGIAGAEYEPGK